MNSGQQQDGGQGPGVERRRLLAGAALVPVLAGIGTVAGCGGPAEDSGKDSGKKDNGKLVEPVPTTLADWQEVAKILDRPGNMVRGTFYHTPFLRGDLHVVSRGITVTPGLALGSHVSFVRYSDGSTMAMGDLVVTEDDLQKLTDALHTQGFTQTAIHKHLLAQSPDVWWTHIHNAGQDPRAIARGLRTVLDQTGTPPATPPLPSPPIDLDTAGIDAALGARGTSNGGIYTCTFIRRETITDMGRVLPPGLASTTAFNFQPLGGGRAALNGDFAMIADEVQDALKALRRGGIEVISLHNHGLTDEPRLFFTHIWAVDDAVKIARTLRSAVAATNAKPSA
ncbi:DUF1259 domain-containing protein [Streptomyces sp. NPDC001407]|uniref:DUF1259 domain-containing protein n=1 Tax=Streptomyces sp. NPDC001407 TaxID=3364573 RepID=UPI0036AC09C1